MPFHPSELSRLADALRKVPGTRATAQELVTNRGRLEAQLRRNAELKLDNLPLPAPRHKALFPANCTLLAASLSFTYRLGDQDHLPVRADYQVLITGELITDTATYELQDHWRIDTHLHPDPAPGQGGQAPQEAHPLFHFQRGGHAQEVFAADPSFIPGSSEDIKGTWRGLFQCPGPRMPALPMDPILAIDFCIAQADGQIWHQLRQYPEYINLIDNAQQRLWRPFFEALAVPDFQRKWLGELVIALDGP